jgi:hypothetical protein
VKEISKKESKKESFAIIKGWLDDLYPPLKKCDACGQWVEVGEKCDCRERIVDGN